MRQICSILGVLLFASTFCFAGEYESKVKISGSARLELGQVVHGSYYLNYSDYQEITKGWQERFLYRLIYDMTLTERIRMVMDIEGQISFSYPQILGYIESQGTRFLFFPERIEGMYTLGDSEKPYLQFGFGYFPYKFNPDARNLGELEFRSGTYPLYVITNFDHCYGKLLGFRVSSTLFGSLKQDLMLTSEALMFPTQDYSLSYAVHYSLARVLDIGAAISFAHLFSIEKKLTEPNNSLYIKANGDTAYYNFKGIKPSAVLAIDPKPLLPQALQDLLGKNDARLYGEVFVSGWENRKNYDSAVLYDTSLQMQQYYANRSDRTVVMFGFNWLTHPLLSYTLLPGIAAYLLNNKELIIPATCMAGWAGIASGIGLWLLEKHTNIKTGLDVLSFEFEHFPNRYPDSYRNALLSNSATPYFFPTLKKQFAWRWSCYAKKTFLGKFFIVGQVARDHLRTTFSDLTVSEKEDVLKGGKDWWWVCSFGFKI